MNRTRLVVAGLAAIALLAAIVPLAANAVGRQGESTVVEAAATGPKVVGYYTSWSTYGARAVQMKAMHTSGAAAKMTHVVYAFGAVENGRCAVGDPAADYRKKFTAAQSVSGRADTATQTVAGNFNQLRQLKAKYPKLKVVWSFGGGTGSAGFTQAVKNPAAFATSCRALVEDKRWADVFDGIDIDWEYPNVCGSVCDRSGYGAYPKLLKAVRAAFGKDLVTSAITGNGRAGGTLSKADYAGGAKYLDWLMPMTYDYYGTWAKKGPTAPHSPLSHFSAAPVKGYDSQTVVAKLRSQGVPAKKLLLGIPYYGRGWTGVTQTKPGGRAIGPATGPKSRAKGVEDYKVLLTTCPPSGTTGGTAYARCGKQWWSYDTPQTVATKMAWAKKQKLGGAFFWDFSGDTKNAALTTAIAKGLR